MKFSGKARTFPPKGKKGQQTWDFPPSDPVPQDVPEAPAGSEI